MDSVQNTDAAQVPRAWEPSGLHHPTGGRRVQVSVSWSLEDKPPLVTLDREY